ncbi:MAG: FHA domain-containing protein [Fimbriimonadaceae bacterium]|nr:FHA domain-containing protein [Fimbriimonadaceae bacterium]
MSDPNKTVMGGPQVADPNKTVMGGPGLDPNKTMMGGPSLNTTITIKPVQCPVCKTFNPPGMQVCSDCGLIFEYALDGDAFGAPTIRLPVLVDDNGREFVVRPGVNKVGRTGDIALEDPRVSRAHAVIKSDQGALSIEDVGSTNGTQVNGEAIAANASIPLSAGDKLSFGGLELVLGMPGEANKTAMPAGGRTMAMAAAPGQVAAVAYLVQEGTKHPVATGKMTFGRRDGNDLVLSDPFVSGSHGMIEADGTGVYLTDTGSTNGTVVNDAKLTANQRTQLRPGDRIKLGSIELVVEFAEN